MADLDVLDPGDNDIVSQYPADARALRATILDLTSGTMFGGGTTGGSANAQTLTISNTGLTLTTGLRGSFIAGFSVSTAAPTLQINSLTAKTMKTSSGTPIFATATPGVIAGSAYDFLYDGTDILILNPSNYMHQSTYDTLYPVGQLYININVTPPVVPLGVTASWTRLTTDQFFKIASGSPTAGGGLTTSGASIILNAAGTTGAPSGTTTVTENPGGVAVASAAHTHSFSADIASHTHTIDPTYRSFATYFRAS
jgi:hypothetical protein